MSGRHPEDSVLLKLAAGSLAPAVRDEVAAHLDGCASCKGVVVGFSEETSPSAVPLPTDADFERTRASDPLVGQMLGEYRVLERLGQGGMGILYRGEQPMIGKAVAIKVLLQSIAADPSLVQRMLGEAQAVNAVRHPNIVDIFSFGRLRDGRPYMVMELLEGKSLAALLLEVGRLSVAQTLVVLSQAMAALEAAHRAGVIHRDLKPDNIFVNRRPEGWTVTLLDFGLAKREGSTDKGLTQPGTTLGTPAYMAPEQVRGQVASTKSDIYAMGVVAWTLLAGREPFAGGSIVEIMQQQLQTTAPGVGTVVADVPAALEQLVTQMLEKNPERRPTATEVRRGVAQLQRAPGPTARRAPAPTEPSPGSKPSRRTAWALGTLGVIGCGFVVGGWWLNNSDWPPAELPEEQQPRPLERPRIPVAVAAPAEVPAPAGPEASMGAKPEGKPEAAASVTQVTWRCSKVTEVGAVNAVYGNSWYLFVVTVEGEPLVLVSAAHTKKGFRDLSRVRNQISDCRSTGNTLTAKRTKTAPPTFTELGIFTGVGVEVDALTVSNAGR